MSTYNIAVIRPNNIILGKDLLSVDAIKAAINEYIVITSITQDSMMELIVDTIKLDSNMMGSTSVCKQDAHKIYQLCHLNMEDNGQKNDADQFNSVASCLTAGAVEVYGASVFLVSNILDDGLCSCASVTLDEIADIIYHKLIHKAVKIGTDGVIEEFTFITDPLEGLTDDEISNYQWMEMELLKFNLILFIQVSPVVDVVNKKATLLVGDKVVNGDVLVVSKSAEDEYLDLDNNLITNLLTICVGTLKSRSLTDDEEKDGERINNLTIVQNSYCILNARLKSFTPACSYCDSEFIDSPKVCTGCYRMNYHNEDCQKSGWLTHKSDCLYGKIPINRMLKKK
jgi:hypothetical protein